MSLPLLETVRPSRLRMCGSKQMGAALLFSAVFRRCGAKMGKKLKFPEVNH
jgi:hypothetical protein